jgi:ferredoxin
VREVAFRLTKEDTTRPFLTSARALDRRQVAVRFSEPVDTLRLAGASLSVADTLSGGALPQLLRVAEQAERTLAALGMSGRVSLGEGLEHAERAESSAEPVGLARRAALEALRRGSAGYAAKAMSVLLPEPTAPGADASSRPARTLPAHVPDSRRRLLGVLGALSSGRRAPSNAQQLFLAPAIDADRCDRCGMCGLICPTGALSADLGDGDRAMRIACRASECVECGLCTLACPSGAIALRTAESVDPFADQLISDVPAESCSRCGEPVLEGGEALCSRCSAEAPLRPLLDSAAVMHASWLRETQARSAEL